MDEGGNMRSKSTFLYTKLLAACQQVVYKPSFLPCHYKVMQRHPRGKCSKNIMPKNLGEDHFNEECRTTTKARQVPLIKRGLSYSLEKENQKHCHLLAMLCTFTSSECITNQWYGRKHTMLYKCYLHHVIGGGKPPTQE